MLRRAAARPKCASSAAAIKQVSCASWNIDDASPSVQGSRPYDATYPNSLSPRRNIGAQPAASPNAASDQINLEDRGAGRTVHRRIAGMLPFRLVDRPAWMLASIDTVKLALVDRNVVNIALVRQERHGLDHLAALGVIFHQPRRISLITGRS